VRQFGADSCCNNVGATIEAFHFHPAIFRRAQLAAPGLARRNLCMRSSSLQFWVFAWMSSCLPWKAGLGFVGLNEIDRLTCCWSGMAAPISSDPKHPINPPSPEKLPSPSLPLWSHGAENNRRSPFLRFFLLQSCQPRKPWFRRVEEILDLGASSFHSLRSDRGEAHALRTYCPLLNSRRTVNPLESSPQNATDPLPMASHPSSGLFTPIPGLRRTCV
jgi:hypothetical protein